MGDDAFTAGLVPGVFCTPGCDVEDLLGGTAVAGGTFTGGAVSAAAVGQGEGNEEDYDDGFHIFIGIFINISN